MKKKIKVRRIVYAIVGAILLVVGTVLVLDSLSRITGFAINTDVNKPVSGSLGLVGIILGLFFLSQSRDRKKGQAAMEFMMTYGWAIMAAIIAIGFLAYLGLLKPSLAPEAIISYPFVLVDASASTSGFQLVLRNAGPQNVAITTVKITDTPSGVACTNYVPNPQLPVGAGAMVTVNVPCSGQHVGDPIRGKIIVYYTVSGSTVEQSSIGTIVDVVQPPSQCGDGIDNDGDSLIDLDDLGCSDAFDNDETNEACADSTDNDGDGWIDLNDPGCIDAQDNDELNGDLGHCADGIDNDLNGDIDGNDPQCGSWNYGGGESQCSNELDDNDVECPGPPVPACDGPGDGWIDSEDPGCHSDGNWENPASYDPSDNSEFYTGTTQCSDQADNDGDGQIDGYDPECNCHGANDASETDGGCLGPG